MFNNEDLNQVTWEQRVMEGDPKFDASQQIPERAVSPVRRADRAEGHLSSTTRQRLGAAWDEALAADRPVVLEVKTDPEVPPLPPHITLEQAKNFTSTLLKGDPRRRQHHHGHREAGAWRRSCLAQVT